MSGPISNRLKDLRKRSWADDLMPMWLESLPASYVPGTAARTSSGDVLLTLQGVRDCVLPKHDTYAKLELHEPEHLRTAILLESFGYAHKATNVLGAAQAELTSGYQTWPIATAYQSAFFSMQALLGLLGVAAIEADDRRFLVDLCAVTSRGSRNATPGVIAYRMNVRTFEHRPLWSILRRLLRVVKFPATDWDMATTERVSDLNDSDFAKARNALIYRNRWLGGDLLERQIEWAPQKITRAELLDGLDQPDSINFAVYLASALRVMYMQLLTSLSTISNLVSDEHSLHTKWHADAGFTSVCELFAEGSTAG